jgi:3'(2'), 5'-bisphosphate nucleotidase
MLVARQSATYDRRRMALLDNSALLPRVREIAWQAGAEILKFYRGAFDVREKADSSPVTEADEAAERIIVPALRALAPGVPVVAEEMMAAGAVVDVANGPFWLVDPLDGTREFVEHRDEFTVNIALIVDRRPALGVVYVPAREETFAAAGPGTACASRGSREAHPIAARRPPADGVVVTASRRHGDAEKLDKLLGSMKVKDYKTAGSSLKFCLVATGEADIYPRYGNTSEWDTAAGHAVLAAAGGSVRTLDGAELLYAKAKFLNPEFIARGLE